MIRFQLFALSNQQMLLKSTAPLRGFRCTEICNKSQFITVSNKVLGCEDCCLGAQRGSHLFSVSSRTSRTLKSPVKILAESQEPKIFISGFY